MINGNYILVNPVSLAINKVREAFNGEAERLGLKDEEDVAEMIKEFRKEKKSK